MLYGQKEEEEEDAPEASSGSLGAETTINCNKQQIDTHRHDGLRCHKRVTVVFAPCFALHPPDLARDGGPDFYLTENGGSWVV